MHVKKSDGSRGGFHGDAHRRSRLPAIGEQRRPIGKAIERGVVEPSIGKHIIIDCRNVDFGFLRLIDAFKSCS